jgi:hypothetical protein
MAIDTYGRGGGEPINMWDDGPPNPGSDEAIAMGCKCPVLDNGHGRGMPGPDGQTMWWRSADCTMHKVYSGASNVRALQAPPAEWYDDRPVLVRIYYSDNLGRRSKQRKIDYKAPYGIQTLRNELALCGEVGFPEARQWGKVIHGIGHEEGVMTVHLRKRYVET